MTDRQPTYAGRVRLTPVAGTTDVFDMEMADDPTEAGTPLNKATLLTDATANAIDQADPPTTPNEALLKLNGSLGNAASAISLLQTSKSRIVAGSYIGTRSGVVETVRQQHVSSDYAIPVVFDKPPILFWIYNAGSFLGDVYFGLGSTPSGNYNTLGAVAPNRLATSAFPTTNQGLTNFYSGFLPSVYTSSGDNYKGLARYSSNQIHVAYVNQYSSEQGYTHDLTLTANMLYLDSSITYRYLIVYDY